MRGLVVSAPASGAGKTVVTLGLLRAFKLRGVDIRAAKSGPDYIDPQFHSAACGSTSMNLDAWAMPPEMLARLAAGDSRPERFGDADGLLLVEGAMGALDGAGQGKGSTAGLAASLGLPLVMVLDVRRQSQSAVLAPLGLRAASPDSDLAGVIFNRVASARHEALLREPFENEGIEVFGAVPRTPELEIPERHLGLVCAGEHPDLERFLGTAAELMDRHLRLDAVLAAARRISPVRAGNVSAEIKPLGQRIAVAHDAAFSFSYEHLMAGWRDAGAELIPFSPLADQAPDRCADAVFLPGGYPELHPGTLASAGRFKAGMQEAANRGASIYGECGGYMVLGQGLIDGNGARHAMLGMLPNETSFEEPRLHLGYRVLSSAGGWQFGGDYCGHEFHYARLVGGEGGDALFYARDAYGKHLPAMGHRKNSISGSFAHLICATRDAPECEAPDPFAADVSGVG